jgi:hypothetical protein
MNTLLTSWNRGIEYGGGCLPPEIKRRSGVRSAFVKFSIKGKWGEYKQNFIGQNDSRTAADRNGQPSTNLGKKGKAAGQ